MLMSCPFVVMLQMRGTQACSQLSSLQAAAGLSSELPCILIGFSKGGVVLNQASLLS